MRRTTLVASLVVLLSSAPAHANVDKYQDSLFFSSSCNPSSLTLGVPIMLGILPIDPFFATGLGWVDYFGIPVAVSQPFSLSDYGPHVFGAVWQIPTPSSLVAGQYTVHVLLQGNGAVYGAPYYFLFTTVSDTATIDPSLPYGCTTTPASESAAGVRATAAPSGRVLIRRVLAARHASARWFGRSLVSRPHYPKARLCGRTICIKMRVAAAWKRIPVAQP
ncbi:MAG: hypothetical protein ACXVHC_07510 [Frankiaceae bacterium]